MTAFAAAESETDTFILSWELRSVNHRYLDISLRLPDVFRALEPEIRVALSAALKRGKVDCTLNCRKAAHLATDIRVNRRAVRALLAAARDIESAMVAPAAFSALDVLGWPGVRDEPEVDMDHLRGPALALLQAALGKLVKAREDEGARLAQMLADRCVSMQTQVDIARSRMPEVLTALRQKLRTRLSDLAQQPDSDRLEQELVYFAQKMDVDEELDRLESHIREVETVLAAKDPVGRRLDFLMQEMNREANTLGSKSADTVMTRISVDLKVLIEQMREQVQNIE